ncbi:hypothetical protein [Nonomuraea sp. NPDC049725]|uniref:hypothetical protein n=1 Tax=Nonomuraea sp. NPDC049725 TaxID=3154508 RepID=UPI003438D59B
MGEGTAWAEVEAAIDAGDELRVAELVLALDEAGRREVAAALPGHIPVARNRAWDRERRRRQARRTQERVTPTGSTAAQIDTNAPGSAESQGGVGGHGGAGRYEVAAGGSQEGGPGWEHARVDAWVGPMRVAGAGTIGGAAAVVAWLHRRDFQGWGGLDHTGLVERVLAARPHRWQVDFAVRAALRLRTQRDARVSGALALAMLRRTGATPPGHDPLTVAWAAGSPAGLGGDPLLDHLLPRLFEADGVGRVLRHEQPPDGGRAGHEPRPPTWLVALKDLADTGRVSRDLLLDGCVRRFLRGGSGPDLRFFVRLHDLLDPADTESARRAADYLRLLPAAPTSVADLALRHLRRAGRLGHDDLVEGLHAALFRPERKLVDGGLGWLDQAVRGRRGPVDEFAPALAQAFSCRSYDVQARAVRLALRHAARFGAAGAMTLREAAAQLPPDLAARLTTAFPGPTTSTGGTAYQGGETDVARAPVPAGAGEAEAVHPGATPAGPGTGGLDPVAGALGAGSRGLGRVTVNSGPGTPGAVSGSGTAGDVSGLGAVGDTSASEAGRAGGVSASGAGSELRQGDGFVRRALPRVARAGALPAPVGAPGELTALPYRVGWQELERWLDGVVRLHAEDPEALRVVLKSLTGEPSRLYKEREWEHPGQWAEAIARRLVDPGAEPPPRPGPALLPAALGVLPVPGGASAEPAPASDPASGPTPGPTPGPAPGPGAGPASGPASGPVLGAEQHGRRRGRLPDASRVTAPHWMLLRRLAEVHAAAGPGALPPYLLATPTTGAGGVGAAELVERVAGYERAGAEALDADLQQALLRLPRDIEPGVVARAARLRSGAGATVAAWMRDRPSISTGIDWIDGGVPYASDRAAPGAEAASGARKASGGTGEGREPSLVPRIRGEATGLELVDRLLSDPRASRWQADGDDPVDWPAVLPHDREVAALHLLPRLLCRTHGSHVRLAEVQAVASAGGPAGEAVALLVAYFLLHREWWRRDDGVRPLLELAARGELPAEETGRQLGLLLRRTWHQPAAMREALETAARRGAHAEVWRVLTGFLPVYLPGPGERAHSGHTQMLTFAVRAAGWARAGGELPCVARIAARKATSGFVREARRLHALLA